MEIVIKPSKKPQPLRACQLTTGQVYRVDGTDSYAIQVTLGGTGTRVVSLKTGTMYPDSASLHYWPVEAVLTVS